MMDMIAKVMEDSVVAGGFLLLLYHVLHKQEIQLKAFAKQMEKSNQNLLKISQTLSTFDARLQRLEEKDEENAS